MCNSSLCSTNTHHSAAAPHPAGQTHAQAPASSHAAVSGHGAHGQAAQQTHNRSHNPEGLLHCSYEGCPKTYSRREHLNRHIKLHMGIEPERPYYCKENVAAAGDKTVNNNMMQLHEDLQLSSSEDEMDVDSFQIRKGIKLTKKRTSKEISSDHSDDITHNRMAELITNKSHEVHQLTLQVNCYKSMMKKYRDRAQALYKENSDLKRHIANIEAKSDFKITRAAAMRNGTRVNQ